MSSEKKVLIDSYFVNKILIIIFELLKANDLLKK